MTIEQVAGRSMREALEKARERLGDRAVVLSQRVKNGGVTLAVSRDLPNGTVALNAMREQAKFMLEHVQVPRERSVGTSDVERKLLARGASRNLTDRVCEAVAARLPEGRHPLDLASEELSAMLTVAKAPHVAGRTAYLTLVGAAGVGKTTTLAKLAARLTGVGKRVVLVTLDVKRVGAVEQMRALGKELGCPVLPIADVRLLARPWKNGKAPDVVLVDSSGRPEQDAADLARLDAALKQMDPELALESYLVVPAVSRTGTLEETLASLGDLPLAGAVVTKVDETANPVPVLEYLLRRGIPLAFVSDGRGLDGALHRASGSLFADLLLQGKVR